jgi:hypothetical protein
MNRDVKFLNKEAHFAIFFSYYPFFWPVMFKNSWYWRIIEGKFEELNYLVKYSITILQLLLLNIVRYYIPYTSSQYNGRILSSRKKLSDILIFYWEERWADIRLKIGLFCYLCKFKTRGTYLAKFLSNLWFIK